MSVIANYFQRAYVLFSVSMVEYVHLLEPVPVRRVSLESTAKRRTVKNSAKMEVSAVGTITASANPDFTETVARKGKRIPSYTTFPKNFAKLF